MSEAAAVATRPGRLSAFPRELAVDALKVGPLQFRKLGEQILMTGEGGDYATLSPADFERFLKGELQKDDALWKDLQAKGFVKDHTDFQAAARKVLERKLLAWSGPCVHRFDVCAPRPMSLETARAAADWAFSTPSRNLALEIAGGEPLSNWPAVRFLIAYARRRAEHEKRELSISLTTTAAALDESRFKVLMESKVAPRIYLDGPARVHDAVKSGFSGADFKTASSWLKRAAAAASGEHEGFALKPRAICRVTPAALGSEREWVEELARLGVESCEIEFMDGGEPAASPEQYLAFYRAAFDHLVKLGLKGKKLKETAALQFVSRVLGGKQWAFPEREPLDRVYFAGDRSVNLFDAGAGAATADFLRAGVVPEISYNAAMESLTERAALTASRLEGQPLCSQCAYHPFCVVQPGVSMNRQGTLWGRMPDNDRCRVAMGIFDHLFQRVQEWELREKLFKGWLDEPSS